MKWAHKRKDYDHKMKIHRMRDSKAYTAYAQKMKSQGREFNQEMYQEMKRAHRAERAVREEQDPEFKEAFKELNIERLFAEFNARPMRTSPSDLAENLGQMQQERKMSARDKARAKFVREHRKKEAIEGSLRNTLIMERERYLDVREQLHYESEKPLRDLKYLELVEVLNKDLIALEQLTGRKGDLVKIHEDMTKPPEVTPEIRKQQDEVLRKTKRIVYPAYAIGFVISSLIFWGYEQQRQLIVRNQKRIEDQEHQRSQYYS